MPIITNNTKKQQRVDKSALFKEVMLYCLPHMLIITFVPFAFCILSLIIRALGAKDAAESLFLYIDLPLILSAPLFTTIKVITVLKRSFPRKDSLGKYILAYTTLSYLACLLLLIVLFIITCTFFDVFPLDFKIAAYMRDMHTSSPAALFVFYLTVFCGYALLSLLCVLSYFKGNFSNGSFKFTRSCLWFIIYYFPVLFLFLTVWFISTFIDVSALNKIQIAYSLFNSGMLCVFISLTVTCLLSYPIFYYLSYKILTFKKRK